MSELVIESGNTCEIVLAPQSPTVVDLATPGPQGPPGPAGPAGGEVFVYDRAGVPAATWTIEHDLGRRVHVTVCDDDGNEVDADVANPDLNTTVIVFATPFSGTALIG